MKIWKYELEICDQQTINMPVGAKLLCIQMQHGKPCIWAICDPMAQPKPRHIAIYGTGQPMPDDLGIYIGTFQIANGSLIFHAFDLGAAAFPHPG